MTDFDRVVEEIAQQEEALNRKVAEAKAEAVAHVQSIINNFKIASNELYFAGEEAAKPQAAKVRRAPSPARYRTPTGIEWSGRGRMKKEFKEYLESIGLTEADKDQFLVNPEQPAAE